MTFTEKKESRGLASYCLLFFKVHPRFMLNCNQTVVKLELGFDRFLDRQIVWAAGPGQQNSEEQIIHYIESKKSLLLNSDSLYWLSLINFNNCEPISLSHI